MSYRNGIEKVSSRSAMKNHHHKWIYDLVQVEAKIIKVIPCILCMHNNYHNKAHVKHFDVKWLRFSQPCVIFCHLVVTRKPFIVQTLRLTLNTSLLQGSQEQHNSPCFLARMCEGYDSYSCLPVIILTATYFIHL